MLSALIKRILSTRKVNFSYIEAKVTFPYSYNIITNMNIQI